MQHFNLEAIARQNMQHFVLEANIARYKECLARESNPETIAMLRRLLAEEESKLADFEYPPPKAMSSAAPESP